MHARHLALTIAAALVAVGGIYLFLEVRGGAVEPPSAEVIEAARQRQAPTRGAAPPRPSVAAAEPAAGSDRVFSKDADGRPATGLGGEPRPPSPRVVQPEDPPPDGVVNPDLDSALLEANKAYDRKDFDAARSLALKLLQSSAPGNVRMLRVVVSSSCILGDADLAKKYLAELPQFDRDQMATRCSQYGITVP